MFFITERHLIRRMNKQSKKVLLMVGMCSMLLTGCGKEVEGDNKTVIDNTKEALGVKHDELNGASLRFVTSLAKSKKEKARIVESGFDDSASIDLLGSNKGYISVHTSAEGSKLKALSISTFCGEDKEELKARIESTIKSFCKEVEISEESILSKVGNLYKEVTDETFLKSDKTMDEIKKNGCVEKSVVSNEIREEVTEEYVRFTGDDVLVMVTLESPESEAKDKIRIDINFLEEDRSLNYDCLNH